MPIFGVVLFGWSVGAAGGFGTIFNKQTRSLDGRPPAVLFFSAMSSAIAPKATLALNLADFTRYAKSPRNVVISNIFSLTILVTLAAILGVVVTSAAEEIYGVSTWNPLQVSAILSFVNACCRENSSSDSFYQVSSLMGNRAAQFFSALMWALAALVTNISANSTAVGNDLMVVFPRWISIRRGQFICAALATAACPWIIQSTAKTFTSFLSG